MAYELLIHKKAQKKFEALGDSELKKRLAEVFGLLSEPFTLDTIKLQGQPNGYRTRVGKYRILMKIEGNTVYIVDFDVRGKVYK